MTRFTVITRAKSAEEKFAAVIAPHYDVLYRVAYRLTRSAADAEDLAQEVCVRAYPRLEELERLEQPRAWLLRVLYRLHIDSLRRYERRHVGSIDDADDTQLVDERPGPFEQTASALEGRRLDRAWSFLDNEQRALLALHDIEGYSLDEIHAMTGFKHGTIKSRLHRARVKLGRILERDEQAQAERRIAGGER